MGTVAKKSIINFNNAKSILRLLSTCTHEVCKFLMRIFYDGGYPRLSTPSNSSRFQFNRWFSLCFCSEGVPQINNGITDKYTRIYSYIYKCASKSKHVFMRFVKHLFVERLMMQCTWTITFPEIKVTNIASYSSLETRIILRFDRIHFSQADVMDGIPLLRS